MGLQRVNLKFRLKFTWFIVNIEHRRARIMSCERQQSSLSCPDSAMSEDVELSSQEDEEEGVRVVCMLCVCIP